MPIRVDSHASVLLNTRCAISPAAHESTYNKPQVPNDASALARLGAVFAKADDETQALHFTAESFRLLPTSLEVISWLGVWCVWRARRGTGAKESNPTRSSVWGFLLRNGTREGSWCSVCHYQTPPLVAAISLPLPSSRARRYVKSELYEKAAAFFGRAAELQPGEIKWRLMVASCHRRSGALGAALAVYAAVHEEHPDNLECETRRGWWRGW